MTENYCAGQALCYQVLALKLEGDKKPERIPARQRQAIFTGNGLSFCGFGRICRLQLDVAERRTDGIERKMVLLRLHNLGLYGCCHVHDGNIAEVLRCALW
jgi:hypothetical protein